MRSDFRRIAPAEDPRGLIVRYPTPEGYALRDVVRRLDDRPAAIEVRTFDRTITEIVDAADVEVIARR